MNIWILHPKQHQLTFGRHPSIFRRTLAPDCNMSKYCYSPLPSEHDTIHLLHLMPNEDETAPIQCQLFKYPLQRLDNRIHLYEALSYVWGDPCNTLPIFVEEHSFPVMVNLHAALSRLRDQFLQRIIWVDAICINQNNEKEKSQQIQLMAGIYSKASRVIVWLGEETPDSERALEEIRLAAELGGTKPQINGSMKQPILELLQREWFKRIWVRTRHY